MYVRQLTKACQLLGIDVPWRTPALDGAAKGLANAVGWSLKFDSNKAPKLFRRVVFAETLATDVGNFMYLSFLYVLRGPFEAIPARRAPLALPRDTKVPRAPMTSYAIAPSQTAPRFIPKLNKRKHHRGPAPPLTPCFFGPDSFDANGIFPVRDIRPLICGRAPNLMALPIAQKDNLSRNLKAMISRAGVPDEERFATHCFRRGLNMEMLKCGAALSVIMKTAGWPSAALGAYLLFLQAEEAGLRNIMSSIIAGASDSGDQSESAASSSSVAHPTSSAR